MRLLLALAFLAPAAAGALSLTDRMIGIATDIAADPASFLYDLHQNNEDFTPVTPGRFVEGGMNLFPTFLPLAMLNGNLKVRLLKEHGGLPQIDLLGGGWSDMAAWFIPGTKVGWWGWNLGAIVSGSIDPRMRVFGGYEYSQMRADLELGDKIDAGSMFGSLEGLPDLSTLNSIHVGKREHYLVLGAELLRSSDKYLVAQMSYGLAGQRLAARLTWKGKGFNTGIAFYPEGSWVIWPFESFTVRF